LDIGGKTQDKCNWHKVGFSQQTRWKWSGD
jgi:hypothetical protein